MKVNVLVLCWVDDNGLISTYAYSTYEKAVEGACKILSDVILKNGKKLVVGSRILTLEQVKEICHCITKKQVQAMPSLAFL